MLDTTDDSVRSPAATDIPVPEPPFWGVREIEVDLDEVYPHLDTHVLFKLHWGGRGVKGEEWRKLRRRRLPPAPGAHVARADLPAPARAARLLPLLLRGQRDRRARPRGPRDRARAPRHARASPTATASAWPTSSARRTAGELDVVALQAVTAGDEVTELMARARAGRRVRRAALHPRPRRADRRGHGRVAALARARRPRHPARRRAAATRGATRRCPSSPSTRRSTACSASTDDRHAALRRLRGRARAVHARAHRPPPAGDLLRHAQRPAAPRRLARRRDQGHRRDPSLFGVTA